VTISSSTNSEIYAVLVIGFNGTIYLESGELPEFARHLSNEENNRILIFNRTEIRLSYSKVHPFFVVEMGSVTFEECHFVSNETSGIYEGKAKVYIADVFNDGEVNIIGGSITNLFIQGPQLIKACNSSHIKINVCFILIFNSVLLFFFSLGNKVLQFECGRCWYSSDLR
jgi:hypothetical protein